MLNALQTLYDEGALSTDELNELIGKCIDNVDLDDHRGLVLLAYLRSQGQNEDPEDIDKVGVDNLFSVGSHEYFVYDEDEADTACGEYIQQTLWLFNSDFLTSMTDLPVEVFQALSGQCEDANDAIFKVVQATCGIDKFVNEAVSADGRGHFLASYDGEENEYQGGGRYFYIYRVN